ncbi:recombinase family protein [Aedoeadaptatus pacaensis]|uniref:recombinase family protein n=1 Tax=Aedoeadaptatus pacaensis TaxID=1776390 RepID=UPI0008391359|nr:recombinase family protein [Peptoniphilus pacaensis]
MDHIEVPEKYTLDFFLKDGNLVVNPKQAKIVKRIYAMYLQGKTYHLIAKALTEDGIPSPAGKPRWNPSNIKSILTNEKYKGDALLKSPLLQTFFPKSTR